MSKFTFRLEPILKLRAAERDARRVELADALARDNHAQHQLDTIDEELRTLVNARTPGAGTVDIGWLLAADRYGAALRENRAACERQRFDLADEITRKRDAALAADRDVRTLEKLREKQLARHQADARNREQRELDEIGARMGVPQRDS